MIDISEFLKRVEEEGLEMYNLIVLQHGKKVASYDWREDEERNIHSVTKSIISAAVGFAVNEGLISVEEYIVDCFPDELPEVVSDYLKQLQVKHLLTMTMGFDKKYLMGADRGELRKTEPNWIKYSLSRPMIHKPGTQFLYSGIGPYLCSVLVERRSGMGLLDYLKPRLFDPLGITCTKTEYCPLGYVIGAGGMHLSCEQLSRFGQMYLDYGMYNGKQILPREWIEESTTMFTQAEDKDLTIDEELGNHYGYFFWIIEDQDLFWARGRFGQVCLVSREKDAVIAMTALEQSKGTKGTMNLRLARRHILPLL